MKGQYFRHHKVGSAGYVVAHAAWQKKRGRNPSMPYGEVKNPRLALQAAHAMLSVKRYRTRADMSNSEIAQRLGVTCNTRNFKGFHLGDERVGGKANSQEFTISTRKGLAHLHLLADDFAECIGAS
ncbi:hypothetical protein IID21_05145 [Patescibacteria group bacterium]|nr:hypothetical protein [Patescibacteria group bacterium]